MSDLTGLLSTFGILDPRELSHILGNDKYPLDGLRDSVRSRALVGIYNELREIRYQNDDENPRRIQELRDQFAMAALTGLAVGSATNPTMTAYLDERCATAYRYADAMLKAREAK